MLDERFKTRIGRMATAAIASLLFMLFIACTDYQAEFDDAFGGMEYANVSGDPISGSSDVQDPESSDAQSPKSSNGNGASSGKTAESSSSVKHSSASSSSIPASSGAEPQSSAVVPASSSGEPPRSSAESSSSMKSSSSVKSSSSLAYHFQLRIPEILYNVVTIGKQTWMADNMAEEKPTFFYPDGDRNKWKYGRLYDWSTAKGICPEGWHLPDSLEWQTLFDAVGGIEVAGGVLQSQNVYGTGNEMFAGYRNSAGKFIFFDKVADFWIKDDSGVKFVELRRGAPQAFFMPNPELSDDLTDYAYSVRCIMDYITDERDRQTYRTVKIGDQVWTAENMNYKTENSFCFNDSLDYCEKYGRLYKWDDAMSVCPNGWHLPNKDEWGQLITTVGGAENAGKALKATTGWKIYQGGGNDIDGSGTDSYAFSALPAGEWYYDFVNFYELGYTGFFWSSSEVDSDSAYVFTLRGKKDSATNEDRDDKDDIAFSVRCVEGEP